MQSQVRPQQAFPAIRLQFDGGMAADHLIDMRELGKSLDGAARIMNAAAELLLTGENAKPRAQTRIKFFIRPIQHGCVPVDAVPLLISGGFQFLQEVAAALSAEVIMQMTSTASFLAAGNITEADKRHAQTMQLIRQIQGHDFETQQLHLAARERSEEGIRELVKILSENNRQAVVDMVTPIGRSVARAQIGTTPAGVAIDAPMADKIRARAGKQYGELQQFRIVLDGFIAHNKTCRFYFADDLEQTDDLPGDVLDPAAGEFPNIYTLSIRIGVLIVTAKPVLEEDRIVRLSIMDAVREDDVSR